MYGVRKEKQDQNNKERRRSEYNSKTKKKSKDTIFDCNKYDLPKNFFYKYKLRYLKGDS